MFNFFLLLFAFFLILWDLVVGDGDGVGRSRGLVLKLFSRLLRFLYRFFLRCHMKFVYFLGKWVPNSFFVTLNKLELLLFGEYNFYPIRKDDVYVSFYYKGEFIFRIEDHEYESLMTSFFMSPFFNEMNKKSFDRDVDEWAYSQRVPQSVDLWNWRDTFETVDDFWEAAVYVEYPRHYWIEGLIKKLKWFSLGEKVSQFAFESLVRYSCFLLKPSMRSLFFQFLFSLGGLCFFFLRKFLMIPFFFILLVIFCYFIFLFSRYSSNFASFIKSASFRLTLNYVILFLFPFLGGFLGLIYFVFRYLKEVFGYVYDSFFRVDKIVFKTINENTSI